MLEEIIKNGTKWGDWRLDTDTMRLVLSHNGDDEAYNIFLPDIKTSAQMLDWIFQLRLKTWVTDKIIGDLVSAFEDIFHPQQNLCGAGVPRTMDTEKRLAEWIESPT